MFLPTLTVFLLGIRLADPFVIPSDQVPLHLEDGEVSFDFSIPTVHESAVMARRILRKERLATLSTVFPAEGASTAGGRRPADVDGAPLGLVEYFGDCEPSSGNPTILALSIASSIKNANSGSNVTLSVRWHPDFHRRFYSTASLPRFALVGYLQRIPDRDAREKSVQACFGEYHPDSVTWMPGNAIHESYWTRLVVREVYWIGGFGDRAYIGWIPEEEWRSVTEEEIQKCRLPGETDF